MIYSYMGIYILLYFSHKESMGMCTHFRQIKNFIRNLFREKYIFAGYFPHSFQLNFDNGNKISKSKIRKRKTVDMRNAYV